MQIIGDVSERDRAATKCGDQGHGGCERRSVAPNGSSRVLSSSAQGLGRHMGKPTSPHAGATRDGRSAPQFGGCNVSGGCWCIRGGEAQSFGDAAA